MNHVPSFVIVGINRDDVGNAVLNFEPAADLASRWGDAYVSNFHFAADKKTAGSSMPRGAPAAKSNISLIEQGRNALSDVFVRQRYGENRLIYRLLEIVERSQLMRVVQFQRSEMTNLVAELTHGVAHRVHAIHQLAVAGIGIDERLYCVADEGEVANIASVVVYRARLLVKQIEQQSSLSGVGAIHVMQADTSRSRAVGFRELLVEVLNPI